METIVCTSCTKEKPETEFTWRNKALNKRHKQCAACRKITKDRYYQNNKKRLIDEVAARKVEYKQKFQQWKETLSCTVCGEEETCCLDFHHLDPSEKDHGISNMMSCSSWETIMEEVKKCIVVCSNCHRKIHKSIIKI